MKKVLLMIGMCCLVIGPAIGAPLTGGTYTIPSLTISSGGSNNLIGGTYKMIDIKGQAVIGSSTGGTYGLGLGGIYGEVVVGGPSGPSVPFVDDPHVRNIRIRRASNRVGDPVIIEWDKDVSTYTGGYYLYWLEDRDFENVATNWMGPRSLGDVTSFSDGGQVGVGNAKLFYRVLSVSDKAQVLNKVAVGKVNINIQGNSATTGKNLVSVPFNPQPGATCAQVFGEGTDTQWREGDLIQFKSEGSPVYQSAIYTSNAWKNAGNIAVPPIFNINPRMGYLTVANLNSTVTVVGKVFDTDENVGVYDGRGLTTGGKTLLGMIYPATFDLARTELISSGAMDGDMIQYKTSPLEQVYISAIVSGGAWLNTATGGTTLDPGIARLTVPNGYIYVRYRDTGFTWARLRPY